MSEETTPGPEGGSADERYMRLALALGRRNLGRTWPNPAVGAVIVKDGIIVGRGWTQEGGRPHAEVEALRRRGLARGGSLQNAVVLDDTGIVSGPLRFRDEFVRHKILDLIGDLALLGAPLHGQIHARKAGHALHIDFARAIRAAMSAPADVPANAESNRAAATARR